MGHDDCTDNAQSLLDSSTGAVLAPRNHSTFKHCQLVGTSIDVLHNKLCHMCVHTGVGGKGDVIDRKGS